MKNFKRVVSVRLIRPRVMFDGYVGQACVFTLKKNSSTVELWTVVYCN